MFNKKAHAPQNYRFFPTLTKLLLDGYFFSQFLCSISKTLFKLIKMCEFIFENIFRKKLKAEIGRLNISDGLPDFLPVKRFFCCLFSKS